MSKESYESTRKMVKFETERSLSMIFFTALLVSFFIKVSIHSATLVAGAGIIFFWYEKAYHEWKMYSKFSLQPNELRDPLSYDVWLFHNKTLRKRTIKVLAITLVALYLLPYIWQKIYPVIF